MPQHTNPAYATLAYRRTIIADLKVYLRERYMRLSTPEPKETLLCDEVFHQDSNVPEEEIQHVVEELEQTEEELRLQMAQFTFSKQEENNGLLSSTKQTKRSSQGREGRNQGRSKGKGKGRGDNKR